MAILTTADMNEIKFYCGKFGFHEGGKDKAKGEESLNALVA
jgi:hypothetical protein